jgi:hypothetical protein
MNYFVGGEPQRDPLSEALRKLAEAGLHFRRDPDPILSLYTAPGFPELTSGQVVSLARQRGLI